MSAEQTATGGRVALAALLARHSMTDPDFWAFKSNSERYASHGMFQYPAMMVPKLQGTLLDDALAVDPAMRTVYDPFAGSGTVIVEAMMRGLSVVAADINPMALLLCTVKSRFIKLNILTAAIDQVTEQSRTSMSQCGVDFQGIDKWFLPAVKTDLYRLRQAICDQRSVHVRRFLWVALAEAVRLTSNSRTSTFKMHAYSNSAMSGRSPNAILTFNQIAHSYADLLQDLAQKLDNKGLLAKGQYINTIALRLGDVRQQSRSLKNLQADILMTSPPYGDNQTTVPYGQHSYLPLQWLCHADLPGSNAAEHAFLARDAYHIDHVSLGGSRVGAEESEQAISARSPTLAQMISILRPQDPELRHKLVVYARDLDDSLAAILARLKPDAFMFWTLGNRRIGGHMIPLAEIVRDLLERRQAVHVATLARQIPGNAKRMALRNDRGVTMRNETILVMRMGAKDGKARRME
jgi:hypothetical protein